MTGRLERLWIKRFHRGPMDAVERASLRAGRGLVGNADQGGKRQVTIISRRRWDGIEKTLADDIDPALRRANLLVEGIDLDNTRGRTLRVGSCRLLIHGETRPCAHMDAARAGLRGALDPAWAGGAFAEVLDDGEIAVGDTVRWDDSNTGAES